LQAAAARLEALEKDNVLYEAVEIEEDEEASMDEMDDRKCEILYCDGFCDAYIVNQAFSHDSHCSFHKF